MAKLYFLKCCHFQRYAQPKRIVMLFNYLSGCFACPQTSVVTDVHIKIARSKLLTNEKDNINYFSLGSPIA